MEIKRITDLQPGQFFKFIKNGRLYEYWREKYVDGLMYMEYKDAETGKNFCKRTYWNKTIFFMY